MDTLPEERLFGAAVKLAIKDAMQTKNERLRVEAWRWLWWVCPTVAARVWDSC